MSTPSQVIPVSPLGFPSDKAAKIADEVSFPEEFNPSLKSLTDQLVSAPNPPWTEEIRA